MTEGWESDFRMKTVKVQSGLWKTRVTMSSLGAHRARSSRCCSPSSVEYHGWEGKKKGATIIGASCCGALPA